MDSSAHQERTVTHYQKLHMQGNGSSSQPASADLHEAENGSKRPRLAAASQPNGQAHAQTSNGQASQAQPAAAHPGSSSNGPGRPVGAVHHHSTVTGSRKGSSRQDGHATVTWVPVTAAAAAAAPIRHQSSAQNPVEELKRLKEKIAAREAQARKEQVRAFKKERLQQHYASVTHAAILE